MGHAKQRSRRLEQLLGQLEQTGHQLEQLYQREEQLMQQQLQQLASLSSHTVLQVCNVHAGWDTAAALPTAPAWTEALVSSLQRVRVVSPAPRLLLWRVFDGIGRLQQEQLVQGALARCYFKALEFAPRLCIQWDGVRRDDFMYRRD